MNRDAIHEVYEQLVTDRQIIQEALTVGALRLPQLDRAIEALEALIAGPPGAQPTTSSSSPDQTSERTPDGPAQPATQDPPPTTQPGVRRKFSDDEKAAAVRLTDEIGLAKASAQLGIVTSVLSTWRRKHRGAPAPTKSPGQPAPPVLIEPKRANPIERSPAAVKTGLVPTGIRTTVNEDAARRAAYGE